MGVATLIFHPSGHYSFDSCGRSRGLGPKHDFIALKSALAPLHTIIW